MTSTYISTEQNNANPGRPTFGSDTKAPPPFEALDRLSNVGQRIDAVLSTLIGQLQPYCSTPDVVSDTLQEPQVEPPSGLEQRIERETALLLEIAVRAEELLGRLRL